MRRITYHALAGVAAGAVVAALAASTPTGPPDASASDGTTVASPAVAGRWDDPGGDTQAELVAGDGWQRSLAKSRSENRPALPITDQHVLDQFDSLGAGSSQSESGRLESAQLEQQTRQAAERRTEALSHQQQDIKDREHDLERAEAKKKARIAARGYAKGVDDPREMARQIMQNKFSWGHSQFVCYDLLIKSESNWRINATNPSSGAYGIPQALPGSKMATIGSDWRTNPATQIRWGLKYVKSRYGTPCSAWSFKQGHNWY